MPLHWIKLCIFLGCSSLAFGQNCAPSPALINNYEREIRSMAVDYMFLTAQDTDAVTVPNQHFDAVASDMAALFNSNLPERDSIFDIFCVHGWAGLSTPMNRIEMIVFFDTSFAWTQNWVNGSTAPTGNAAVDQLLTQNMLSASDYTYYASFPPEWMHRVLITGEQVFNIDAAIDALMDIPGINFAEPNSWIGGAGRIEFGIEDDKHILTFEHEWSDCFDGCDEFITWRFGIEDNCEPILLSREAGFAFSATPPPASNCNITTATRAPVEAANALRVTPNPTMGTTQVSADFSPSNMVVFNALGQVVQQVAIANAQQIDLDLGNAPAGWYRIVVTNERGEHSVGQLLKLSF